jgi:hypothetical protein
MPDNRATRRHLTDASTIAANGRTAPSRAGFRSADFGVEALSYNFEEDPGRPAYKGPERGYVEIPEPSGAQITALIAAIQEITRKAQGTEPEETEVSVTIDGKKAAAQLLAIDPSKLERYADEMADATTAVTDGNPSREEMDGLPLRVKMAFSRYVTQELLNPKSASGDTKN